MEKSNQERLESLSKERARNESDKRFVLSKEAFSVQRLDAVKQEVDRLKEKYPEVLSLCLFGSMVKGTAHEGSDIDGELFIDTSIIARQEGVSEDQILDSTPNRNRGYLTEEVAKKYLLELRAAIKEKTGLTDEGVKHIRSMPISEKVINDRIASAQLYYEKRKHIANERGAYTQKLLDWQRNKPPRGSSIDLMLENEKNKPSYPKLPDFVSTGLGPLFHLDVGGGIRTYRKLFIDKLVARGEVGEQIWADTISSTIDMENNFSNVPDKRYPRTLKEAQEVYAR